jgi:hypothetical protein
MGPEARVPTVAEFKQDFLDCGTASRHKAATACVGGVVEAQVEGADRPRLRAVAWPHGA